MNKDLIEQFNILKNYYKFKNDKGRTIAYGKAVASLKMVNDKITDVKMLKGVKNVGKKIIEKISEYLKTGKIMAVENIKEEMLKSRSPRKQSLEELESVWGIGPVKAKKLYEQGINSVSMLQKNTHLLTEQQKIGLKYWRDLNQKIPRITITCLYVIMRIILDKYFGKSNYKMEIAGSYRRGAEQSGDIDCLISTQKFTIQDVVKILREKNIITDVLGMRKEKFMGIAHCPSGGLNVRLDIEFVTDDVWGTALLYFTGSKEFNVLMRSHAKKLGFLLNEHGLFDIQTKQKILQSPTEKDVFDFLDMNYLSPEQR
jgi:DNA polymerase beta